MPTWKSTRGVWTPAKEKTYVDYSQSKDPRTLKAFKDGKIESHMHEGPDRAATEVLKEKDQEFLGGDIRQDPDLIMRARQMGKTIEEYLHLNDTPTPSQKKAEKEKEEMVVTHQPKPSKPGVRTTAGGFGEINV